MKILKVKTLAELVTADLGGVTEIQAMDMCLDGLPQDFFLRATSLEILYLKSSWREAGLPAIPATVKQLFCCNQLYRGRSDYGHGSSRRESDTPPKPERRPFVPELPPPAPEDPTQPNQIEHNGKTMEWDPESQEWKQILIDVSVLPASLEKFYASEVFLGAQPLDFSRFTCMEELIINQCGISNIVAWPPNVRLIYANWNRLETVPEFPASVEIVELNDNRLTMLSAIAHTRLHTLRVDKNHLSAISEWPETLVELRAERNQLVALPTALPTGMLRFYVRHNRLTGLPIMAHSELVELFCGFNRLTVLPQKPLTLEQLYCHDNCLRSLGDLHEGLLEVYCGYNKLEEHPQLPTTCTEFNGVGNQFDEIATYAAQQHMLRYQMSNGLVRAEA